jgi:type IV pilus assembly protein PilY1
MHALRKSAYLKVAALLAALGTASLYAVMDFSPSTQPAITLGNYGLQSTDLSDGGTIAYRPFFDNVYWQGDIIEYEIDSAGNRSTDAQVGANPAASGTTGGCGRTAPLGCWSARAVFDAKEASVTDYWKEVDAGRNIFTLADTDDDGIGDDQADFLWDNLSDAQKAALDASTAANALLTGSYDSPVLNFIRGDRTLEKGSGFGGTYRNRNNLLGDVVNSGPVYIGAPVENYTISGFVDFKNAHSGTNLRDGRIAFGANDGMLHVLDEDDGSEVYAYVPSMLLDKLSSPMTTPTIPIM